MKEYFNDFVENRVEEICRMVDRNRNCRRLSIRIRELQTKIISRLGNEHSILLFEYEEAQIQREAIIQKVIFRQGLLDGISLVNSCRVVKGDVTDDLS